MSLILKIERDDDPINPRVDFDNLGTMICFHKRYNLGDPHTFDFNNYISWDSMETAIRKQHDIAAILPIYMYDHGGITIRTTPFSCPWDSGQIGFIFITKQQAREEYGWKKVTQKRIAKLESYLDDEVQTYNKYLLGDVWGYVLEDEAGDQVESCWGYFDGKIALEDGRAVLQHYMENQV